MILYNEVFLHVKKIHILWIFGNFCFGWTFWVHHLDLTFSTFIFILWRSQIFYNLSLLCSNLLCLLNYVKRNAYKCRTSFLQMQHAPQTLQKETCVCIHSYKISIFLCLSSQMMRKGIITLIELVICKCSMHHSSWNVIVISTII